MTSRHLHIALCLCAVSSPKADALASDQTLTATGIASTTGYTSNSLCRQNQCINPIFPGLNDLPRLEALTWQCSAQTVTKNYMDFCKDAVIYDPALPSPDTSKSVAELVKAQDDAAMTMFVYHLNGMGYDAWDYRVPAQSDNDCVRSVWKMVCYTYFPRSNAGCASGQVSLYQRPCQSSCSNYIAHCGIECCDESVQCAFTKTQSNATTGATEILQTGYVDVDGPSAKCTGASRRSVTMPILLLLSIFGVHLAAGTSGASDYPQPALMAGKYSAMRRWLPFVVLVTASALFLQGCDAGISRHEVGNWRVKTNYLNTFKYLAPGGNPRDAILNSCSDTAISATEQCSGRGYCKSFSTSSVAAQENSARPLSFCSCDPDWADPECSTQRKSQMTAWFYSIFLGMFGADYFYLGYPLWGTVKLLTLGGLGFWWLIDIVRISSGPVYASNFRTANDLPHWAAILALVFACIMLGFMVAIESYLTHRTKKRADVAKLQNSEEDRHYHKTKAALMPAYGATWPEATRYPPQAQSYTGYGSRPMGQFVG